MPPNSIALLLQKEHTVLVSTLEDVLANIAAVCSEVLPVSEKRIIFSVRLILIVTISSH